MLRRNQIITTAALVVACAVPATAAGEYQDLRSADAQDAARAAARNVHAPTQDLRSPDARDAARDRAPVQAPAPTVVVHELPQSTFDWGDAAIGAAGILALLGIAAGSTLLAINRRRLAALRSRPAD
jgi:hypothetical protein